MNIKRLDRRAFLKTGAGCAAGAVLGSLPLKSIHAALTEKPVVSVVRIEKGKIDYAVERAVDLLGGIRSVTVNKERILLKPNLVGPAVRSTTKPPVVTTLAKLMKAAGKEVLIGEGSAAAPGFNFKNGVMYRTGNREILDGMQKHVFDRLGYTELAESLDIPLVNLHSGELVDVEVPGAFVFDKLTLHRSVTDADLLCSVPMMKTHGLATVTLGMKNLFGLFPGTVYHSVRSLVHKRTGEVDVTGTAAAIVDMVRANKLGLVVIDASTAMEGQGPSRGTLVKMNLIIAGTNPLATDMVAAKIMGFEPKEISTFTWALKAGMTPTGLGEIEVRGEQIEQVARKFNRPKVVPWSVIKDFFGVKELA